MPSKSFLKNLTIPTPCDADWNSMVGNDQVRFCEHCSLDVHNLTLMTRNQAQRLVARSNGRLCVRYHSDGDGKPLALPLAQKLHRINRRVSRIAAGAFSATLSITSAVSQNSAGAQNVDPPNATQQSPRWVPGARLMGVITDQNGALIPGATIFLSNADLQVALYASTGLDGQFRIDNLQGAVYKLRIEAPGFAADQTEGLFVQGAGEVRVDRSLKIAQVEETVEVESNGSGFQTFSGGGAVAYVAPEHPFVKAAQEDDLEALTALIAGMDVNMRDKRSDTTALEHAVRNANREMVQLLLSAGADVNKAADSGETVLMMLDDDATSDLIWDLINAGANVNRKDKFGSTALMAVAASNNLEALKTLLDAGAEVSAKNEEGQTALMLAASGGHVNNVRTLVLAGADITAKDKEKMDALAHAIDNDHRVVVRFLKSKGAVETVAKVVKDE